MKAMWPFLVIIAGVMSMCTLGVVMGDPPQRVSMCRNKGDQVKQHIIYAPLPVSFASGTTRDYALITGGRGYRDGDIIEMNGEQHTITSCSEGRYAVTYNRNHKPARNRHERRAGRKP